MNKNINLYANYTFTLNPARDNDAATSTSFRQTSSPYSIYPGVISKVPRPDFLRENTNQDYYHVANAYGEFQNSYGKHNVKFMAGYNQELKQFKGITSERGDLLSQDLNDIGLGFRLLHHHRQSDRMGAIGLLRPRKLRLQRQISL